MNEVEWLQSLDQPADVGRIDVTCDVMCAVKHLQRDEDECAFSIGAAIAVVAGAAAIAAVIPVWNSTHDPFVAMFEQFRLVLQ